MLSAHTTEALIFVDIELNPMTSTLSQEMTTLDKQLEALQEELSMGHYIDPGGNRKFLEYSCIYSPCFFCMYFLEPSKRVLKLLSDAKLRLDDMIDKAQTYAKWRELFKKTPYQFEHLSRAQSQYDNRMDVWTLVDTWSESAQLWTTSSFQNLNVELINEQVMGFYRTVHEKTRKAKDDLTLQKLKTQVERFKLNVPLMLELGNPAMKKRHWERVFKELQQVSSSAAVIVVIG